MENFEMGPPNPDKIEMKKEPGWWRYNKYFGLDYVNHTLSDPPPKPMTSLTRIGEFGETYEIKLWACDYCGAVVMDYEQHTKWHDGKAKPFMPK